tara:strand:- start:4440 stop:4619 length:180 start_codon:yes stop_codon:yes gene_type:complete
MIYKNANAKEALLKLAAKKSKGLTSPVLGKIKTPWKTLQYPKPPKTSLTKFLKKRKFEF